LYFVFCDKGRLHINGKKMKKQDLMNEFIKNHQEVVQYIDGLNESEFGYSKSGKWTAGQQLEHILLTIKPFPKILNSKTFIREKFGNINRPTWSYHTVLENYTKTSLKAPAQFVPQRELSIDRKAGIIAEIDSTLKAINEVFENYTEDELDSLTLPHPLLGQLTIREMFYLMSYHPLHHQKQMMIGL